MSNKTPSIPDELEQLLRNLHLGKMAEILGDEDWTEAPAESPPRAREEPHSPDLEAEIDEGLSVLDDLMSPARPPAGAQADPSRQGEGIDLGEVGDLAAIPLASPGSGAAEQDEAADAVGLDFVGDPRRPSTGTGEVPSRSAR